VPFWWDELADAARGGLEPHQRDHCLDKLQGRSADILSWAASHGITRRQVPWHQRGAREEELTHAASQSGITLASHSWSHPNLATLSGAELEEELVRPLAWLRQRFAGPLAWLSYPYGLYSPRVEAAAAKAGYEGALRVDGGWTTGNASAGRFALPRVNVPAGLSLNGFIIRAAGMGH
jgi:peptidoglycan/xylan/chitin deacetylase (PgdA/CDA1 family)